MHFAKLDERRSPALALASAKSAKSASAPIFGAQSASAAF
jgi:hypothetical protein